ncbi:MAG TPA: porin [Lacipirellulaceae bacterium]|jgi:phosphate-selective porin OprO/OprP
MTTRWKLRLRRQIRRTAFAALAAVTFAAGATGIVSPPATAADLAAANRLAPMPQSMIQETSWDDDSSVTAENSLSAVSAENAALTKRVAALEQALRSMQEVTPAAAEETLPAAKGKDDAPNDTCKQLDPIIKPTFQFHGRIYFDGVDYSDDPADKAFFHTDRNNEIGFRTFRIGGNGNIYENLYYNVEFEVRGTNSAIQYKDIYMEQQHIPWIGHLRAGHFKEPIGLEEDESDLYLTFMEKSPATKAFSPARNFGMMAWDTFDDCQDASWFAGIFAADSPDSPDSTGLWRSDDNDWSYDARVAVLPYYDEPSNGRYLVHLGGSYSFRHIGGLTSGAAYDQNVAYNPLNGLAQFATGPWVGSQAPLGFGAEFTTDEYNEIGAEFLTIWGASSFQSEYFEAIADNGQQFNGGYAQASYFLTGENRAYVKDLKVPGRVQPFEPFFWVDSCKGAICGKGAWELAFGYSWVDLTDGQDTNNTAATAPATGGTSANRRRGFNDNFIVGVNWYQNPWSRVFFDYEHEIVDFVDAGVPTSNANIFGMRWQIDW